MSLDTQAPDGPTAEEIEAGRLLFCKETTFLLGAAELHQLPDRELPEICFAGRSNVGKSSLINALVNRKDLARTSVTPGRTQQLNVFDLGGRLTLCDMPGYGYAKAPKAFVEQWTALVRAYLRGRPTLRRALVLIDSRHGILEADRPIMTLLDEAAVSFQIILTKIDKPRPHELAAMVEKVKAEAATHVACHPEILLTSSHEGDGLPALRAALWSLTTT